MRRTTREAGISALMLTVLISAMFAIVLSETPFVTAADTTDPTVIIGSPSPGSVYKTNVSTITVTGTCSDDTGVTSVTWQNSVGGTGDATLQAGEWSAGPIQLSVGDNVITVYAHDSAGNTGYASVTVNYAPFEPGTTVRDWTWIVVGIVAVALVLIIAYMLVFRKKK